MEHQNFPQHTETAFPLISVELWQVIWQCTPYSWAALMRRAFVSHQLHNFARIKHDVSAFDRFRISNNAMMLASQTAVQPFACAGNACHITRKQI